MENKEDAEQYVPNPEHLDGTPDMSSLIYLEQPNVLHNLEYRYESGEIYTYIQNIIVAVNPYESLPIYGNRFMRNYRGLKRAELARLPPHLYAVAEKSFQNMSKLGVNQSMVICGESGSGKTETAKHFMRYLADSQTSHTKMRRRPSLSMGLEQQLLQANPVLEAFGNAQTILNNNSSRFGKFTKVTFVNDFMAEASTRKGYVLPAPKISGSFIETYLLEKTRVSYQGKGERNYHIFYQVCKGLSASLLAEWKLTDISSFHFLNQSGVYEIQGVSDKLRFDEIGLALTMLGIQRPEQLELFEVIAGILHLGNVNFDDHDADAVTIEQSEQSQTALSMAAKLFHVGEDALKARLISRNIKVGMQVITKPLQRDEAPYNRDAIAKALFSGLFNWIVRHVNSVLEGPDTGDQKKLWIGILDVFGFEFSDWDNSFEQLCINFANERLQQFFNEHVILSEQDEYLREALPWEELEVPSNKDIIDLIEGKKPPGIISLLDSACVMPKGTDAIFMQNLFQEHRKNPRIKQARKRPKPSTGRKNKHIEELFKNYDPRGERFNGFTIKHYAGTVTYNSVGFLDKNADSIHADTIVLFGNSDSSVTKILLNPPVVGDTGADSKKPKRRKMRRAFNSVGTFFTGQLAKLMYMLQSTQPQFVRCMNPNQFKQSKLFDKEYVRPQLICGGIMESLRILKLGYPSRVSYDEIFERFQHILRTSKGKVIDAILKRDFAEAVFVAFGMKRSDYQLGLTKVFFRPGKQEFLEDVLARSDSISEEETDKINALMIKKRFGRLRAGILLLVRLQTWHGKQRSWERITRAFGIMHSIAKVVSKPMVRVRRRRAVRTLQADVRTFVASRHVKRNCEALVTIQKTWRVALRQKTFLTVLRARATERRDRKRSAATSIQGFWASTLARRALSAELARRVEETRLRKERENQMEADRRAAEEVERKRKLEEERLRIQKLEEERRRQEEEQRKKDEEERLRREQEEQKQQEEERIRREAAEDERRKRLEEAERLRLEQEKLRVQALSEAAREEEEKAQRIAKEEEERRQRELARQEKERAFREKIAREQSEREAEERQARAEAAEKARKEAEVKAIHDAEERERVAAERVAEEAEKRLAEQVERLCDHCQVMFFSPPDYLLSLCPKCDELTKKIRHIEERLSALDMEARSAPSTPGLPRAKAAVAPPSGPPPAEVVEKMKAKMRNVLLDGAKFLKFGKHGKPHIKHVCLNVLGNLHWHKNAMDPSDMRPSDSFIKSGEILSVERGKATEILKRKVAHDAPEHLCFSIITHDRTLDLQAVDAEQRDLWIMALESVIKQSREEHVVNFVTGAKSDPTMAAERLNDIASIGRVRANSAMPKPNTLAKGAALLSEGERLFKHGRQGRANRRWINCDARRLYWGSNPRPSQSEAIPSFVDLAEVHQLEVGKNTAVFRRKTGRDADPDHCFSLILKRRTLDLQCPTEERRDAWVEAIQEAMDGARQSAREEWLARKRGQSALAKKQSGVDVTATANAAATASADAGEPAVAPMLPPRGKDFMERIRSHTIGTGLTKAKAPRSQMGASTFLDLAQKEEKKQAPSEAILHANIVFRNRGVSTVKRPLPPSAPMPAQLKQKKLKRRAQKLREVANLLQDDSLYSEGRRLLSQGSLVRVGMISSERYTFFLFNDLLVYASITEDASKPIRMERKLDIHEYVSVEDLEDTDSQKFRFKITYEGGKTLTLIARSQHEKDCWLEDLERCVVDFARHNPDRIIAATAASAGDDDVTASDASGTSQPPPPPPPVA